jgi:hypothetical protein
MPDKRTGPLFAADLGETMIVVRSMCIWQRGTQVRQSLPADRSNALRVLAGITRYFPRPRGWWGATFFGRHVDAMRTAAADRLYSGHSLDQHDFDDPQHNGQYLLQRCEPVLSCIPSISV